MKIIKARNVACPIDSRVLLGSGKQLVCDNGHSYDISHHGYIHLLPVQQKRSKDPGDSKAMVVARTQFLNAGFYQSVAEKLVSLIETYLDDDQNTEMCLLDAGCGEGYYLEFIMHGLQNMSGTKPLSLIGLDISKHAILVAAKRSSNITWLVGTNRQPPVLNASIDIILCVFGFHSFEGFKYCLKPGGIVIVVEPGAQHLKELREIIYTDVKKTEAPGLSQAEDLGFSIVKSDTVQFQTGLINNETIKNLLLMTPHFFRANKEGRDTASKIQKINLTVDMIFHVLKKDAA